MHALLGGSAKCPGRVRGSAWPGPVVARRVQAGVRRLRPNVSGRRPNTQQQAGKIWGGSSAALIAMASSRSFATAADEELLEPPPPERFDGRLGAGVCEIIDGDA